MPRPSIGRIVHYRLATEQAIKINHRRADAKQNLKKMRAERPGFQAHVGNQVEAGEFFAMTITRVQREKDIVNGQVTLDGNDTLWVVEASRGTKRGQWDWAWAPRQDEAPAVGTYDKI